MKTCYFICSIVFRTPSWELLLVVCVLANASAEDSSFRDRVAPILEKHCLRCHNDEDKKGGLSFSTQEAALKGGESGQTFIAVTSHENPLLLAVVGDRPEMPKNAPPLSKQQVETLREWVDSGAIWPQRALLKTKRSDDHSWWSLVPLVRPNLPPRQDTVPNPAGGPEQLAEEGIGNREDWVLKSNDRWHGFGDLAPGFNMLDPIKATVITPGLDVSGAFSNPGMPASVVTKYLAEHGIIVEKTGLYSFFIMFTIGITKGRWNSLVTELQQFKDDYDNNRPLWRILPAFVGKYPQYEKVGLRDLCSQIHGVYKANDIARLTTEMYLSNMEPAMRPADAWAKLAHREIERVEIDHLEGRITSVLLTPYPPGIPLLIPGERFNAIIVRYLKFAKSFNQKFPGFDTDIHGLVADETSRRSRYYVDCVAQN